MSDVSMSSAFCFGAGRSISVAVAAACLAAGLLLPAADSRAEVTWEVFQLTNDNEGNNTPDVSGTTYVWKKGLSSSTRIFMWSEGDAQPVEISTESREYYPRISGRRVIWESQARGDYEIRLWDDGVLTTLTNNDTDDRTPDISGPATVWLAEGSFGLLYYDGEVERIVTAGGNGPDAYPSLAGGVLTWEARMSGDDPDIFRWDGNQVHRITDNDVPDVRPKTDGQAIVWYAQTGPQSTGEIWKWTAGSGVEQITRNNVWDFEPDVSGEAIVFGREVGGDHEIFLLFDHVEYQITNNNFDDNAPRIDGKRVTWSGTPNGQYQVFYALLSGIDGGNGDDIGACCVGLTCIETTHEECTAQDGSFQGVEAACQDDACGRRPATSWSTLQHDSRRTGRAEAVVADRPELLWSLYLGADTPETSPVIRPDGVICVTTTDVLTAVHPDGSLHWISFADPLRAPAVRADGEVWIGTEGLELQKLDGATGAWGCGASGAANTDFALDSLGRVFIGSGNRLLRINHDCSLDATTDFQENVADAPAIGVDKAVHINVGETIAKVSAETGEIEWEAPVPGVPGAPAVADDGTILRSVQPRTFIATNPDGSNRWTLTLPDAGFVASRHSPAIALDGTAYFTGRFDGVDPAVIAVASDGTERWRFVDPLEDNALQAILDGAGRVILSTSTGNLVALNPSEGSEAWRTNVGGRREESLIVKTRDGEAQEIDDQLPPIRSRINLDDQGVVRDVNVMLRLDHARVGDLDIVLTHEGTTVQLVNQPCGDYQDFDCTRFDDRALMRLGENCENGFCATYWPATPLRAFNGLSSEGRWELVIRDRESSNTGVFHEWTLEVEASREGTGDFLRTAPIIGDDGVLYVKTGLGFLKAYGAPPECPASDVLDPPYTYRRVATEGEYLQGLRIEELVSFQLLQDGKVSFFARAQGAQGSFASFVEQADGTFHIVEERGQLDGQRLDSVSLTRVEAEGNSALPGRILDRGAAVFYNDALLLQASRYGGNDAPLTVYDLSRSDYADMDDQGGFLVLGQMTQNDGPTFLRVDPRIPAISPIIEQYTYVDGFRVEGISPTPLGAFGPDGVPVFRAQGQSQREGILTPQNVIAEVGDEVDGWILDDLGLPRRDRSGRITFIADGQLFVSDIGGAPPVRLRRTGDVVAGLVLDGVTAQMPNARGDIAFTSLIVGDEEGVFINDDAVAVSGLSRINGVGVRSVRRGGLSIDVGVNEFGQVAFIAGLDDQSTSLFVATRHHPLDRDGDCHLDLRDWSAMTECLGGPAQRRSPSCALADADGDCRVDLKDVHIFLSEFTGEARVLPDCP